MAQAMDDYGAYYIETTRLPEALKRLERALIPPTPEILGSEFDRVATLTFADTVLKIPIYATLHPNTESGYSPEEDTFIELKIGDRDILIWTGVFATAVQTGGRIRADAYFSWEFPVLLRDTLGSSLPYGVSWRYFPYR